ncbi:MAG: HEAT repeat domain-containing protein [bacterium]
MKRHLFFCLSILVLSSCKQNESELVQLLRLEDRRLSCDSLSLFLQNPQPRIRARAVQSLGKLQDQLCVDMLLPMFKDQDVGVRLETAFALGQIGQPVQELLIEHFGDEPSIDVKRRLIEALGKVGDQVATSFIMRLYHAEETALRAEAALSTGRMALRGVTDSTMTDSLATLLTDKEPEVRWKACYSLMRIASGRHVPALVKALRDEDSRVRMFAVQALGNLKEVSVLETLGSILRKDPDWRVRVKVAHALSNYPLSSVANYLSLHNQGAHCRKAIIQTIGQSVQNEPKGFQPNNREHNLAKHQLQQGFVFPQTKDEQEDTEPDLWPASEIGAALISYAQLLGPESLDVLRRFADFPNPKVQARAMQACGEVHSPKAVRILEGHYPRASSLVKIAILQAFTKLSKFTTPRLYLNALREDDHVLVALAAHGLSQDSLKNKIYAQPIIDAYQRLPKPVDAESANMIFEALGKIRDKKAVPTLTEALKIPDKPLSIAAAKALQQITGEDYSQKITAFTQPHHDFSNADISKLQAAKALIKTNIGTIEIKLFVEEAPLTVLNFVRLTEKGFYDRLTFHRVVPNFVIQGGDPRGDSWGSPGYSIRSEFNSRPFLRGTVGMASAGKDTEGCQFFITHSEQPRLDGRYTVFGQVTSGMEVVDAIQEGDVMELVTIKR